MSRKWSSFIVLVILAGALAFGQNGTSFTPAPGSQSAMPGQDASATPVNSTNPASSTLPVPPAARTNGAPATSSESTNPASPANATSGSTAVTPSAPASAGATASGSGSNAAAGNHADGSQPASTSYARPLADDVDIQVPPNTEMHAVLDTPLSTKISKAGDRFSATVVDSVRGSNGSVAIPAGTRLNGEITEASQGRPAKVKATAKPTETVTAASSLKDKGKLSVHFRDAVLPNGQTVPLNASLVSVNSTGAKALSQTAKPNVGLGNSGGSSFGGPLHGFAIGSMSGGGHILAIRSRDVDLPAQTGMVIRFDQVSHE